VTARARQRRRRRVCLAFHHGVRERQRQRVTEVGAREPALLHVLLRLELDLAVESRHGLGAEEIVAQLRVRLDRATGFEERFRAAPHLGALVQ
jgi:hypothetical protein